MVDRIGDPGYFFLLASLRFSLHPFFYFFIVNHLWYERGCIQYEHIHPGVPDSNFKCWDEKHGKSPFCVVCSCPNRCATGAGHQAERPVHPRMKAGPHFPHKKGRSAGFIFQYTQNGQGFKPLETPFAWGAVPWGTVVADYDDISTGKITSKKSARLHIC